MEPRPHPSVSSGYERGVREWWVGRGSGQRSGQRAVDAERRKAGSASLTNVAVQTVNTAAAVPRDPGCPAEDPLGGVGDLEGRDPRVMVASQPARQDVPRHPQATGDGEEPPRSPWTTVRCTSSPPRSCARRSPCSSTAARNGAGSASGPGRHDRGHHRQRRTPTARRGRRPRHPRRPANALPGPGWELRDQTRPRRPLPRVRAASPGAPHPGRRQTMTASLRILIVEDVDLAVLDVDTPGATGIEAAAAAVTGAVPRVLDPSPHSPARERAHPSRPGGRGLRLPREVDDDGPSCGRHLRRPRRGHGHQPGAGRRCIPERSQPAHRAGGRDPAARRRRHGHRRDREGAPPLAGHGAELRVQRDDQARRDEPDRGRQRGQAARLAVKRGIPAAFRAGKCFRPGRRAGRRRRRARARCNRAR